VSATSAPADLLTSGRDDGRGGSRRRRAVTVLVVLLVVGAVAAERWESDRQRDALLDAAVAAEAVVQDARRSTTGMVQYTGSLLARPDLDVAQRTAVLDSLAVDARRFPPRIAEHRAAVAQVRPLPWDEDLADARAAVLARIDAWTAFLDSTAQQPETLLFERRATRPAREQAAQALAGLGDPRGDQLVERLLDEPFRRR